MSGATQPAPLPHPPVRVLIRGVNWLGDAVMTTPALTRLREAHPGAQLTLLTHEKLAELWFEHPAIDSVLTFGADDGVWTVARKLREHAFDTALILPNSARSALESFLARIPRRVGGTSPWRNWLLTNVVPARPEAVRMRKLTRRQIDVRLRAQSPAKPQLGPEAHQLHHYLHLAAALGARAESMAPWLHVTAAEEDRVREKFGLTKAIRWIGLNAGAEYGPAKRWPVERFVAAAQMVVARTGGRCVVFGGKADVPLAADLAGAVTGTLNLAGHTTLRELYAALKACAMLLTNDTGPMHLAAAVGTPVVVPFGSTSPELTGPGLPGDRKHRLVRSDARCSPCFLRECPIDFRCMKGISVERVVEAAMECLAPRP